MNPKQFVSDKILSPEHWDRINSWLRGENPFPITMEIDPTNVCNHQCPGCCGWPQPNRASLSRGEMLNILDQANELGIKAVIFTGGGEPLYNESILDALFYCKMKGLDVGLITNGSLLHKFLSKTLLECCSWIRISLDAGDSGMHRKTHGSDDFKKIIRNICNLITDRDFPCTVGLGYLTGENTDDPSDMMKFVDLAVHLGVDYAQFRPYLTVARKDMHRFKPIDWKPFEEKANDITDILCSKHKYDAMADGEVERKYEKCYGHQFATTVCANGDVTICCHTRGLPWATLGNIKERSFREIWNSDRRMAAIQKIDLDKCPLLCRCNTFNEILWLIRQKREHVNFL